MNESDARRTVVAEVAARLRPICSHWPRDLFDEMVERLADITVKYDRTFGATYDRRSTERLVADLKSALERSKKRREIGPRGGDPDGI